MKRKLLSFAALLILLVSIPLTSCAPMATVAEEGTSRPLPICNPAPSPKPAPKPGATTVPYTYEVLEAKTDRDTSVAGITSPIARLTLQNTDNISGPFTVRIFFYSLDKFTADSQKKTLALPSQRLLMDSGEKYKSEQLVHFLAGGIRTVTFLAPEVDMFNHYWYWRYEIVPPVKPYEELKGHPDPVLDIIYKELLEIRERDKERQEQEAD